MSTAQGNIFLTTENLAFSLPLIVVCGTYAYFKFIPLIFGLPVLALGFFFYQIRSQIQTQREKKIQNMDEKQINDLAFELEDDDNEKEKSQKEEEAKKLQKKKNAVATRLEHEKRKEEKAAAKAAAATAKKIQSKKKNGAAAADDDDDDDVDVSLFANSANKKKK